MVQQVLAEALGKYSERFESSADGNVVRLSVCAKWEMGATGAATGRSLKRSSALLPSALAPPGSAGTFCPASACKVSAS